MVNTIAVILAAGQGKRMQSDLPKVLHKVAGRPMVEYSLEAATAATKEKPVIVVGHKADLVKSQIGHRADFVFQAQQLGTGHAVLQAEKLLKDQCRYVLVLSADMPLLSPETLQRLIAQQRSHPGPITITTIFSDNSHGFGRVVRDRSGQVQAIVEEAVATLDELLIRELNVGVYCFDADWLWKALHQIQMSPKGEYFLTDLVAIAVSNGLEVQALTLDDPAEALGINTQEHLVEAELLMGNKLEMVLH
jgi:bifunctional UDP-N-acetylglucosamine pyrophosphorylase/glucosamine-1-phosphate N-acetyltransferase